MNERKCSDCIPYLVLKVTRRPGLVTSEGTQILYGIDVAAYFSKNSEKAAISYQDLVEEFVLEQGCVPLMECGCFCRRGDFRSAVSALTSGLLRYSLTMSGVYSLSDQAVSVSVSESL